MKYKKVRHLNGINLDERLHTFTPELLINSLLKYTQRIVHLESKFKTMYNITINNNNYDVIPQNGENHEGTINGSNYAMEMAQEDAHNWMINKDGKRVPRTSG